MKAYETIAKLSPTGKLELPGEILELIRGNGKVRIIILLDDEDAEEKLWMQSAAEHFLEGYDDSDAIYDRID